MTKRAMICLATIAVTSFLGAPGQAQPDSTGQSTSVAQPQIQSEIAPAEPVKIPGEVPRADPNPPLRALVLGGGGILQTFLICFGIGGTLWGIGSLFRGKQKEGWLLTLLSPLAGVLGFVWPQIQAALLRAMGAE